MNKHPPKISNNGDYVAASRHMKPYTLNGWPDRQTTREGLVWVY